MEKFAIIERFNQSIKLEVSCLSKFCIIQNLTEIYFNIFSCTISSTKWLQMLKTTTVVKIVRNCFLNLFDFHILLNLFLQTFLNWV